MALEGPWGDVHPQGALLVGASFADQAEHLALALGQRLLAGLRGKHHPRRAAAIPGAVLASLRSIGFGAKRGMLVQDLLDHATYTFELLNPVFARLLHLN